MSQKTIRVSAPCRIDFAGGTLDLWPLCALLGDVYTVNHAVTLRAQVTVEPLNKDRSEVHSEDLDLKLVVDDLDPGVDEGPLKLIALALRALPPPSPVKVSIKSVVPKGSGLGASSTIMIATLNALGRYRGKELSQAEYVALARDLEARLIGVPTGTQDYWAALRGGLLTIHYFAGQNLGEPLKLVVGQNLKKHLSERLMVFFSGEQHFSAAPNWSMLKGYVENEGDGAVRQGFAQVAEAARDAVKAFKDDDVDALEAAISKEWAARKTLSEAVCPPRIGEIMGRLVEAGVTSMKLCGAGGGGSLICLAPPGKREAVLKSALEYGLSFLDAQLDPQGVVIEEL
jgi:D-glycero-alpha-D-manno-heptose-7-phosphate kinase